MTTRVAPSWFPSGKLAVVGVAAVVISGIARRAVGWHDPLGSELGEVAHASVIAVAYAFFWPPSPARDPIVVEYAKRTDPS